MTMVSKRTRTRIIILYLALLFLPFGTVALQQSCGRKFLSAVVDRPSFTTLRATEFQSPSVGREEDGAATASGRSVVFGGGLRRRDALVAASSLLILASDDAAVADDGPVVLILGAGGRTGMAVADAATAAGLRTVTTTRTGADPFRVVRLPPASRERLSHLDAPVDVTSPPSELEAALRRATPTAVVFAASASKVGGDARRVDAEGAANAALAAHAVGARFVLVSALAVDRPSSKSYRVTNDMGGYVDKIMDRKREGEDRVREIYRDTGDYVIVRPGVLLSGKTRNGAADVELNQGDTVGGGLSRDELAGVVVGTLMSPPSPKKDERGGVTVEAYRRSTRTALQPEFPSPSGNELSGETYAALFDKAKRDAS